MFSQASQEERERQWVLSVSKRAGAWCEGILSAALLQCQPAHHVGLEVPEALLSLSELDAAALFFQWGPGLEGYREVMKSTTDSLLSQRILDFSLKMMFSSA